MCVVKCTRTDVIHFAFNEIAAKLACEFMDAFFGSSKLHQFRKKKTRSAKTAGLLSNKHPRTRAVKEKRFFFLKTMCKISLLVQNRGGWCGWDVFSLGVAALNPASRCNFPLMTPINLGYSFHQKSRVTRSVRQSTQGWQ